MIRPPTRPSTCTVTRAARLPGMHSMTACNGWLLTLLSRHCIGLQLLPPICRLCRQAPTRCMDKHLSAHTRGRGLPQRPASYHAPYFVTAPVQRTAADRKQQQTVHFCIVANIPTLDTNFYRGLDTHHNLRDASAFFAYERSPGAQSLGERFVGQFRPGVLRKTAVPPRQRGKIQNTSHTLSELVLLTGTLARLS